MATGTRKPIKKKGFSRATSPVPVAGPSSSIQELDTLVEEDNSEDVEDRATVSKKPSSSTDALLPNLPALPESSDSEHASDSDSEFDYPIATAMSTTSLPHGLVYPAGAYPYIPEMPESKITPLLLLEYQRIVEDHAARLRHPPCGWQGASQSSKGLTFIEFVDLMRERFLEKDWDTKLRLEIREMKMGNTERFMDWLQPMLSKNHCLQGTKSHFDDSSLIENVDTNICPALRDIINEKPDKVKKTDWETYRKCMDEIDKTYHKKTENVKKVNQKELLELRQELNTLKSLVRGQSSSSSNTTSSRRGGRPRRSNTRDTRDVRELPQHKYTHPYYATKPLQGSFIPWGAMSASIFTPGQSAKTDAPPRLTEEEHAILTEHDGCNVCRRFKCKYRTNRQKCEAPIPSSREYRPVSYKIVSNTSTSSSTTTAQASTSKRSNDKEERPNKRPKTVNAVEELEGSSMEFSEGDLIVAAVRDAGDTTDEGDSESLFTIVRPPLKRTYNRKGKQPATVAAVSTQDDTDEERDTHDTENSAEQGREAQTSSPVSVKPPKVLIWECKVTDAITSDFPVTVHALIDSGAALVLISEEIVLRLGLERHPLPRPMSITTATRAHTSYREYVKLLLSSNNLEYQALPTHAIIVPSLSYDIILGMPFLRRNNIQIDTVASTVTDVARGYTLVGHELQEYQRLKRASRHIKPTSPHEQVATTKRYRKALLAELKDKLKAKKEEIDADAVEKRPLAEIIAAISARITGAEEELRHREERERVLRDFEPVFADVPHVDKLPTDVLAEIKLKDANFTMATRTYSCPQKFREAWKTLIQQHLDAGRIQESSAPMASPAFIIPKADPATLPRWVNDYRTLNKNTVPDSYPLPRIDDILADCAKGRIWGTIDMTNAFFQTRMKPSDISLTAVSTPFEKECDYEFPEWTEAHQAAFDGIKQLVLSAECLTVIDHTLMPEYRVFVTTDASDTRMGAMLSFGKTWESARPVAFDSKPFKGAELNYPVHEKELFAIVRALTKWRSDLLGISFTVLTDHRTLECFQTQKHLSRRQARWMELLQQYDFEIVYVKGEDNAVADALSRTNFEETSIEADTWKHCPNDYIDELEIPVCAVLEAPKISPWETVKSLRDGSDRVATLEPVMAVMTISPEDELRKAIVQGYQEDSWCKKALETKMDNLTIEGNLLFYKGRLIIPRVGQVRETILSLAHKALGHFGFDKTYETLRESFYWPGMRTYLESAYIPSCLECQKNKAPTTKPVGPLHPLPVPDDRFSSIAMDFVGPFPEENGFNYLLTITDRLGADVRLIPCTTDISAPELAELFFTNWYCENGLPAEIICDRDKLFLSTFWQEFTSLLDVKVKMSTAFHPQTDGSSERTNKTVNQLLRNYVTENQEGWVQALPRVRFAIMNTVNASTGYTALMGKEQPAAMIVRLGKNVMTAQDNLLETKINQAATANKHRRDDFPFKVGDQALLSTKNRMKEVQNVSGNKIASKLAPRYDGPYEVVAIDEPHSTVTLDVPGPDHKCRVFHTSVVRKFISPVPEHQRGEEVTRHTSLAKDPPPIMTRTGPEYVIEKILQHRRKGNGYEFEVKWRDFPDSEEHNEWMTTTKLKHTVALEKYLQATGLTIRKKKS
ncbi:hypothetical protein NP233_g6218 [Leucocoprinus birnbaumii]|uniref:Reverse transcriptase n=1 Tax=Leucocoprinus birnbaumii TaxID=56174 RepID=A0AAD5VSL4_9AGAR|nr:hypothetical protein NP233_g6218 [Leucocoprinus birnbaumii]